MYSVELVPTQHRQWSRVELSLSLSSSRSCHNYRQRIAGSRAGRADAARACWAPYTNRPSGRSRCSPVFCSSLGVDHIDRVVLVEVAAAGSTQSPPQTPADIPGVLAHRVAIRVIGRDRRSDGVVGIDRARRGHRRHLGQRIGCRSRAGGRSVFVTIIGSDRTGPFHCPQVPQEWCLHLGRCVSHRRRCQHPTQSYRRSHRRRRLEL